MNKKTIEPYQVTILIPNLNGGKFLEESIESACSQTYPCKVLVIDNGSSDSSIQILEKLRQKHKHLDFIIELKPGISAALNAGIEKVRTRYLARLDSDDLMVSTRIEEQLKVISQDPSVILVGSNLECIDASGNLLRVIKYPEENLHIKKQLHVKNPIAHPSVLVITDNVKLVGKYRSKFDGAEDLDLWLRLQELGDFYNIQRTLTKYRIHSDQSTKQNNFYKVELYVRKSFLFKNPRTFKLSDLVRLLDLTLMSRNMRIHRAILSRFNSNYLSNS